MITYMSFVLINYYSHTVHVDPLFNNFTQAHSKFFVKT